MSQQTEIKVTYDCPASLIFKTMTDQTTLCQFTQSPCISELRPGGKYQVYGDTIQGEYVSVEQKIEMKWKFKDWENFSNCVISFEGGNESVDITVKFTQVPDHDRFKGYVHVENIVNGWKQNIFKKIH